VAKAPESRATTIEWLLAAGIAREDTPEWLDRFEQLRQECGCVAGARSMVAALLVYPLVWHIFLRPLMPLWASLALWGVTGFLASGIGKAAGIHFARIRLRRLFHLLDRTPEPIPVNHVGVRSRSDG
jgi:hypothetical protein